MAFSGASLSRKSSIFSDISNTITIIRIKEIEKKKVPKNFLMIYQSMINAIRTSLALAKVHGIGKAARP